MTEPSISLKTTLTFLRSLAQIAHRIDARAGLGTKKKKVARQTRFVGGRTGSVKKIEEKVHHKSGNAQTEPRLPPPPAQQVGVEP